MIKQIQKTAIKDDNFLNFVTRQEKPIDKIYKKLVNSNNMSEETRGHLKPMWTKPGIIYGSCKVHKKCDGGCSPFRPILFALQTPTSKLAKYVVPLLESLTTNKYKVKNLFNFASEIVEEDSSNLMGSLDIDSLFPNISLEEIIDICSW